MGTMEAGLVSGFVLFHPFLVKLNWSVMGRTHIPRPTDRISHFPSAWLLGCFEESLVQVFYSHTWVPYADCFPNADGIWWKLRFCKLIISPMAGVVDSNPEQYRLDDGVMNTLAVGKVFRDNDKRVNGMDYTPDGKYLITSSDGGTINLYELDTPSRTKV